MPSRAIWKGTVKLTEPGVNVKLYSAVKDQSVHFHLLKRGERERVKQRMETSGGEEVPKEGIRKGYEIEKGTFVVVTPEDLDKVEPPTSRDIEILRFVPLGRIGHQWYERPYYLGPDGDDGAYFALAEALAREQKEGVVKWVMRRKHYLGVLRVEQGYLLLMTLRTAEEVLSARDLPKPSGRDFDPRELKMAEQLVTALAGEFHPEKFKDEYRERVMQLIQAKARGEQRPLKEVPRKKPPQSLLDSLSASLAAVKEKKIA